MALARQSRSAEAAQVIAPVVKMQRDLNARNKGDRWLPLELAEALDAQALSDPQHRTALLREVATLVDGLVPAVRSLHDPDVAWADRQGAGRRLNHQRNLWRRVRASGSLPVILKR
jgi:hypothetical protein